MNTTHLKRVRKLFASTLAPRHVQRHNMRAWVTSVRHLGTAWRAHPNNPNRPERIVEHEFH